MTVAAERNHSTMVSDTIGYGWVMVGVFLILIAVIPLQRVGIGFGDTATGSELPVATLGLTYFSLFFFWISGRVYINIVRFGLFLLTTACLFLTVIVDPKPFSLPSILFILICYVPFVFTCPVTEDEYAQVLRWFSNFMIVAAVITLAQFVIYMYSGERTGWYEMLVPKALLIQGYNTNARLSYEMAFSRPNGEMFLEPSFTSQFLAVAVIVELIWLRRFWRIGLLAAACFASLSGTGILLLAFYGALVAIQKRQFYLVLGGIILFTILKSLPPDSVFGFLAARTDELDAEGSSGYMRFVGPFIAIPFALGNDFAHWIVGLGPGAVRGLYEAGDVTFNAFVFSKLMIEYGLLGTIPAMMFFGYCFFTEKFNYLFALALFFMFNLLSGSLQQPHTVFLFFVLSIFFQPKAAVARS